jgi:hypothetical protein
MGKLRAPDRWGGKSFLPIGRAPAWKTYPDVHPDDRGFWERLPDDEESWLYARVVEVRANLSLLLSRLPDDSLVYDIQPGLSDEDSILWDRVSDLHDCTLRALRRTTTPEEWVYALSDEGQGYRFWPHPAPEASPWYVSPVPDGDDQYFVCQDLRWGISSFFSLPHWVMCVYGEPLVKAFEANRPRAFTHAANSLRAD